MPQDIDLMEAMGAVIREQLDNPWSCFSNQHSHAGYVCTNDPCTCAESLARAIMRKFDVKSAQSATQEPTDE